MRIINKELSYQLYEKGEFGNKLRTWDNAQTLLSDTYNGVVTMRYAGQYNKWCEYNVKQAYIESKLAEWERQGADTGLVRFNENAPDDSLIIQGEFGEDKEYGYILSYSIDKVKMREAMKLPQDLVGIPAFNLLKKHMSWNSMINTERLLSLYPYSVIEFSIYDHFLGNIPENNTVFWETRNY